MNKRKIKIFGAEEIRKLRSFFCLSRAQFADYIGVTEHAIKSWETGQRNPSVPVSYLLQDVEKEMVEKIKSSRDDHSKGRAIFKKQ